MYRIGEEREVWRRESINGSREGVELRRTILDRRDRHWRIVLVEVGATEVDMSGRRLDSVVIDRLDCLDDVCLSTSV